MSDDMRKRLAAMAQKKPRKSHDFEPEVSLDKVKRSREGKMKKRKGGSYQRHVAKLFMKWTGDIVKSTPLSGGWSGGEAFGVKGDLVFAKVKKLHVECKKHENWRLEDIPLGVRTDGTTSIPAWWRQTLRECHHTKLPMLVFARNRLPDLLMMRTEDMLKLKWVVVEFDFLPRISMQLDSGEVSIIALSTLFAKCKPVKGSPNRTTWKPGELATYRADAKETP